MKRRRRWFRLGMAKQVNTIISDLQKDVHYLCCFNKNLKKMIKNKKRKTRELTDWEENSNLQPVAMFDKRI